MKVAEVDRVFPAVDDCEEDVLGKTEWTEQEVLRFIGEDAPSEYPKVKTRFKLYDDDRIAYFAGWLLNDDWCAVQQTVLEWGTWYAGCTIIEVKVNGEWKQEIA